MKVGGTQSPDAAGELDVMAVVQLGQVIEAARLHGEGQAILPAVVGDREKALFVVDIGGPVLAHGAQLDEVGPRRVIAEAEEEVERPEQIIDLRERGVLELEHREGRTSLL